MDFGLSLLFKILILAAAAGGVFLSKKYLHTKDDNIIEEMVEDQIEKQIGINVDLSPETPEDARRLQRLVTKNELISPID